MLHKTRGIVFSFTEYRETSLIVKIYTELFGLQTYIVNGVRKKNSRQHSAVFQPLTPVELVVYHKDKPGIQRLSEIRPSPPLHDLPFNVIKSTITLFLSEVIGKSVREEEGNPLLFEFLHNSILQLDLDEKPSPDFHQLFLIRLTKYIGFFPVQNFSNENCYFSLSEGKFQSSIPLHPYYLNEKHSENFSKLIQLSSLFSSSTGFSSDEKKTLLENILEYYRLHIEGFGTVKSHKVLEQVFE
ncbi:MAG: DNA repair protein RecO [Bacteroidia bacterium]